MSMNKLWDMFKRQAKEGTTTEERQDNDKRIKVLTEHLHIAEWEPVNLPHLPRFENLLGNQRLNPNYQDAVEVRITRLTDGGLKVESPGKAGDNDPMLDWFETNLKDEGDYVCFLTIQKGQLVPVEAPDHVPVREESNWEFSGSGGGGLYYDEDGDGDDDE